MGPGLAIAKVSNIACAFFIPNAENSVFVSMPITSHTAIVVALMAHTPLLEHAGFLG